jgi:hypothetical protein
VSIANRNNLAVSIQYRVNIHATTFNAPARFVERELFLIIHSVFTFGDFPSEFEQEETEQTELRVGTAIGSVFILTARACPATLERRAFALRGCTRRLETLQRVRAERCSALL